LATSAFLANAAVAESNGEYNDEQVGLIAYNLRQSTWNFIDDPESVRSFTGSCSFTLPILNYKLDDKDQYWDHCTNLRKIFNFLTSSSGPMLYVMSRFLTTFTLYLTSKQTAYEKRDWSFLISNLGNFKEDDLQFGPTAKLISIHGTTNSYWKSNRTLWQITSSTINNKMSIVVAYPAYLVTETDVNHFINVFTKSLKMAAESDSIMIGRAKGGLPKSNKLVEASKKILKSLPLL
jgi:hypothetical protein